MEQKAKWTAGEWNVVDAGALQVCAEDGLAIAELWRRGNLERERANARLIAAAPRLVQALQLLHDNLAEYQRINNLGGYDNHDMRLARAALAKAGIQTGEA